MRDRAALLRVAVGAVLISFAPVLVRIADVGPTPAGFYRMAIGGAVLAVVVAVRRGRWRGGRGYLPIIALSGLCFAADLAFWHRSIHLVGPGLATILANFQVFVLAGFGIVFLREHASPRLLVAIPLAVTGLFLVVGIDWGTLDTAYRWGVAFGLLTAVSYASYLLTLRQGRLRADGVDTMATVATLSLVSTGALAASVGLEGESFAIPSIGTAGILLAYAVLIQVIAWVLVASGLPRLAASQAGLLLLLQPTLAFVWDVVLFQRPTSAIELVGAAITLAAIYLGLAGSAQQQPSGPERA